MVGLKLSGEFDHTLDPKGRVTLPARYREYFEGGVVLVRMPDREPAIRVYHPKSWDDYDQRHIDPLDVFEDEDDAWRTREIYRNQDEVKPDKQHRILLPAKRVEELGLSGKVKILGARTHLEIWDPETFEAEMNKRRGETKKKRGGKND